MGNIVQQTRYENPILGNPSSSTRPVTTALGKSFQIDLVFDEHERLVLETGSGVQTSHDSETRVKTRYQYDARGNQISQTINYDAQDSSKGLSRYTYFDGADRAIAVVTEQRILSVKTYDTDGDLLSVTTYATPVADGVSLNDRILSGRTASGIRSEFGVPADAQNDQTITYAYNAIGLKVRETRVMSATSDQVTRVSFSESQSRTRSTSINEQNNKRDDHESEVTEERQRVRWEASNPDTVDANVSVSLDVSEIGDISGGLKLRVHQSTPDPSQQGVFHEFSGSMNPALDLELPQGEEVSLEIYYSTLSGDEQLVEWMTITVPNSSNDVVSEEVVDDGESTSNVRTVHLGTVSPDIVTSFEYDPNGNLTRTIHDLHGNEVIGKNAYNAAGSITRTIAPDGQSDSRVEYNTRNQEVFMWTGGADALQAPLPSVVGVDVVEGTTSEVEILVNVGSSSESLTVWAIWDHQTKAVPSDVLPSEGPGQTSTLGPSGSNGASIYGHATGVGPKVTDGVYKISIPLSSMGSGGEEIFFRVLAQDSSHHFSWTGEQKVTLPTVRVDELEIKRSVDTNRIEVEFTGSVENPRVVGTSNSSNYPLVSMGQNRWSLDFPGGIDATQFDFKIEWEVGSRSYRTATARYLATAGDHTGRPGNMVRWEAPTIDGSELVASEINGGTPGALVILDGEALDSHCNSVRTRSEFAVDSGVPGDMFSLSDLESAYQTYARPSQLSFQTGINSTETKHYDAYYGTRFGSNHTVEISFSDDGSMRSEATYHEKGLENDTDRVGNGNKIQTTVSVTLDANESSLVDGTIKASYRKASDPASSFETVNLTGIGNATGTLSLDANSTYDLKLHYQQNSTAREVIVEWFRLIIPSQAGSRALEADEDLGGQNAAVRNGVNPIGPRGTVTGKSLLVVGKEMGGRINGRIGEVPTVEVGLYTGPVDADVSLAISGTENSEPGYKAVSGRNARTFFVENRYDILGNRVASNEEGGIWTEFGIDAMGRVIVSKSYGTLEQKNTAGHFFDEYTEYDARGNSIRMWGEQTAQGRSRTDYAWDYAGNMSSKTIHLSDSDSFQTRYEYDGAHNLKEESYSGNGVLVGDNTSITTVRSMFYDPFGNKVSETDALNQTTTMEYGSPTDGISTHRNRLIRKYVEGNAIRLNEESYEYDAFGRRTKVTDGLGHFHTFVWDQNNRLTKTVDADANARGGIPTTGITEFYYDKRGNRIWTKDANGNMFGRSYNKLGLLTGEYSFQRYVWSGSTFVDHGSGSTPTSKTAAEAEVQRGRGVSNTLVSRSYEYDLFQNKISETDPVGRRTLMQYGAFSRLNQQTVQDKGSNGSFVDGITTNYHRDAWGRIVEQTNSFNQHLRNTYDDAGQLLRVEDLGLSVTENHTYDRSGRKLAESIENSSTQVKSVDLTYVYYDNGWLKRWTDAAASNGDIYLQYEYDRLGNKTKLSNTNTDHQYRYDAANQITVFIDSKKSETHNFHYDAAGRRTSHERLVPGKPNQTTHFQYTENNWVKKSVSGTNQLDWVYDSVGNILSLTETDGGTQSGSTTNSLDSNYLTWKQVTTGKNQETTTSKFDLSGRLISEEIKNKDNKTVHYSHSYANDGKLSTITASGIGRGSTSIDYDKNRNLSRFNTGGSGKTGSTDTFLYNSDGKIIEKTDVEKKKSGTTTETTRYLYERGNPIGEYSGDANSAKLDTGVYAELKEITVKVGGEQFPTETVIGHTITAGETLQSISLMYFGNSSLWFVLAEANALTGHEPLPVGQRLVVPNTVANGRMTYSSHPVYDEGKIVGSELPDVVSSKTTKSHHHGCNATTVFVVIAIVAVAAVASVFTFGAADVIAAGVLTAEVGETAAATTGVVAGSEAVGVVGGSEAAGTVVLGSEAGGAVAGTDVSVGIGSGSAIGEGVGVGDAAGSGLTGASLVGSTTPSALVTLGGSAFGSAVSSVVGGSYLGAALAIVGTGAVVGVLSNTAIQGILIAAGFQQKFDYSQWEAASIGGGFTALGGAFLGAARAYEAIEVAETAAKVGEEAEETGAVVLDVDQGSGVAAQQIAARSGEAEGYATWARKAMLGWKGMTVAQAGLMAVNNVIAQEINIANGKQKKFNEKQFGITVAGGLLWNAPFAYYAQVDRSVGIGLAELEASGVEVEDASQVAVSDENQLDIDDMDPGNLRGRVEVNRAEANTYDVRKAEIESELDSWASVTSYRIPIPSAYMFAKGSFYGMTAAGGVAFVKYQVDKYTGTATWGRDFQGLGASRLGTGITTKEKIKMITKKQAVVVGEDSDGLERSRKSKRTRSQARSVATQEKVFGLSRSFKGRGLGVNHSVSAKLVRDGVYDDPRESGSFGSDAAGLVAESSSKGSLVFAKQSRSISNAIQRPSMVTDRRLSFGAMSSKALADFKDRASRLKFVEIDGRNRDWKPVRWTDAIGNSYGQMRRLSAKSFTESLRYKLESREMTSGQTYRFSEGAVLAFAEETVGAVGGDPRTSPKVLPLLGLSLPEPMA
ncbi:hypothetical protein MK489_18250 [Myxococcota bacterium]|nr:hypothetical protein [Myxococcota bacterium]